MRAILFLFLFLQVLGPLLSLDPSLPSARISSRDRMSDEPQEAGLLQELAQDGPGCTGKQKLTHLQRHSLTGLRPDSQNRQT